MRRYRGYTLQHAPGLRRSVELYFVLCDRGENVVFRSIGGVRGSWWVRVLGFSRLTKHALEDTTDEIGMRFKFFFKVIAARKLDASADECPPVFVVGDRMGLEAMLHLKDVFRAA